MVAYTETATGPENAAESTPEEEMSTSEERLIILRMIEQGKISPEEGARLLAALGTRTQKSDETRTNYFDASRMLHVRVTEIGAQRHKVDVALPVGLVRLALRFVPASVGIDADAIEDAIDAGARGLLTEVVDQERGVRVEISLQ